MRVCIDRSKKLNSKDRRCVNCWYKYIKNPKNHSCYTDGRTSNKVYCVDCDKEITKLKYKRCKTCSDKKQRTDKNLPFCVDCSKSLANCGNKRCCSCNMKSIWKDKTYRKNTIGASFRAYKRKPNKTEKYLNKILKILFPKKYKFVGDGKVIRERERDI